MTPGIKNKGMGDVLLSEGKRVAALRKHREANSREGTGTAYDSLSVLK